MRRPLLLPIAALISLAACTTVVSTQAQPIPGPHPAYLHALGDLRAARHYLNDGWAWEPVRREDEAAIREINAAINELRQAAIDDGKNPDAAFAIDARMTPQGRFHRANELLWSARNDIARAEDVPQSRGLRDRAISHIDRAHQIVDDAQRTARWQ